MLEIKQILFLTCDECGERYASLGEDVNECARQAENLGWEVVFYENSARCRRCRGSAGGGRRRRPILD